MPDRGPSPREELSAGVDQDGEGQEGCGEPDESDSLHRKTAQPGYPGWVRRDQHRDRHGQAEPELLHEGAVFSLTLLALGLRRVRPEVLSRAIAARLDRLPDRGDVRLRRQIVDVGRFGAETHGCPEDAGSRLERTFDPGDAARAVHPDDPGAEVLLPHRNARSGERINQIPGQTRLPGSLDPNGSRARAYTDGTHPRVRLQGGQELLGLLGPEISERELEGSPLFTLLLVISVGDRGWHFIVRTGVGRSWRSGV